MVDIINIALETNGSVASSDTYSGSNTPNNAINGSYAKGNGYNFYGGTKLAVEFADVCLITGYGLFTTGTWGNSFNSFDIYYTLDPSVTVNSDISEWIHEGHYSNIDSIEKLGKCDVSSQYKALKVMIVFMVAGAIVEFEIYGNALKKFTKFLIKQDNKVYTIKNNMLEEILVEITNDVITTNGCDIDVLNQNINLLNNDFCLIYDNDIQLLLNGIKNKSQLIVASNDFNTIIQEHIDYFKNESEKFGNGQIKVAFSIDSGTTWKTHNGTSFVDLTIEIPLKEYTLLSPDELTKWDLARDEILLKGIDTGTLETLDFNTITFNKIRFAYVLNVDTLNDVAKNKKLLWQFDSKGSMKQMKDNEFDASISVDSIEFKSLIDNEMVKVNILPNGVAINGGSDPNLKNQVEQNKLDIVNIKNELGLIGNIADSIIAILG